MAKGGELQDYMKAVMERRIKTLRHRADWVLDRWGKRVKLENPAALINRKFLEKHAVGIGADICCGDFLVEDAIGVDSAFAVLGTDYHLSGDDLSFSRAKELDYVVTNYIEALPNTLKAMNEWHRCLKVGGIVALVCRDADTYTNAKGALSNRNRVHTFTKVTIAHYLSRAEFSDIKVVATNKVLHVTARKA